MAAIAKSFFHFPDRIEWNGGNFRQVELSRFEKVQYVAGNVLRALGELLLFVPSVAYSAVKGLGSRCISVFRTAPENKIEELLVEEEELQPPPQKYGSADSIYQLSGFGTRCSVIPFEGRNQWDEFMTPEHIEGIKTEEDFKKFFVDPRGIPPILKHMGENAYRFSLEWSVIEPEPPEPGRYDERRYDESAIKFYRDFIQQLKDSGITPQLTLHHFVHPKWFEKMGGFEKAENIPIFVNHALKMMELFPEIEDWMTFNEFGVYAMSGFFRGNFPPGKVGDVHAAGQVMRNMLIAHCQIYQKASERFPDKKIGATHQWLKFLPLEGEGNPVQRSICKVFSVYHEAMIGFLKTGTFRFSFPGMADIVFSIPKEEFLKNGKFLRFLGVQAYGFARIFAGPSWGKKYPGYKTINKWGFTFGSTCKEGGTMQSFGPGCTPEDLETCLNEASTLGIPLAVTETGGDAMVQPWGQKEFALDNRKQLETYEKIFRILRKFKLEWVNFWTVVRRYQMEWDRGFGNTCLGTVDIQMNANHQVSSYVLTPAAMLKKQTFAAWKDWKWQEGRVA